MHRATTKTKLLGAGAENFVFSDSSGGEKDSNEENLDVYLSTVMSTKIALHKESNRSIFSIVPIRTSDNSVIGLVRIWKNKIVNRMDALINGGGGGGGGGRGGGEQQHSKLDLGNNFMKEDLVMLEFVTSLISHKLEVSERAFMHKVIIFEFFEISPDLDHP